MSTTPDIVDPVPERHAPLPQRIWRWIREHKVASAGLVALYATFRFGRWVFGLAWFGGEWFGFGEIVRFLTDHWLLGIAACALVFVAAFFGARFGITAFERYEARRKRREAEREEAERQRDAEDRVRAEDRHKLGLPPEAIGSVWSEIPHDTRDGGVPNVHRTPPRIG